MGIIMLLVALSFGAIVAAVIGFLLAIPVYYLWNWVCVHAGLPSITYTQAWGIYVLCAILFQSSATSNNDD